MYTLILNPDRFGGWTYTFRLNEGIIEAIERKGRITMDEALADPDKAALQAVLAGATPVVSIYDEGVHCWAFLKGKAFEGKGLRAAGGISMDSLYELGYRI